MPRSRCTAFAPRSSGNDEKDVVDEIAGVRFFEGALKVGFKPHDNERGILPVVADLTTTDESAWCRCIGEPKAGSHLDSAGTVITGGENRRAVKVGLSIAHAGTGIHADEPTGPVIDRCGCSHRRLYGHVGRKSRCRD